MRTARNSIVALGLLTSALLMAACESAGGSLDMAGCVPTTCMALGKTCGTIADGCGQTIPCGTCPAGQSCGGGGVAGKCASSCVPLTCAQQSLTCGPAGDGCNG